MILKVGQSSQYGTCMITYATYSKGEVLFQRYCYSTNMHKYITYCTSMGLSVNVYNLNPIHVHTQSQMMFIYTTLTTVPLYMYHIVVFI